MFAATSMPMTPTPRTTGPRVERPVPHARSSACRSFNGPAYARIASNSASEYDVRYCSYSTASVSKSDRNSGFKGEIRLGGVSHRAVEDVGDAARQLRIAVGFYLVFVAFDRLMDLFHRRH